VGPVHDLVGFPGGRTLISKQDDLNAVADAKRNWAGAMSRLTLPLLVRLPAQMVHVTKLLTHALSLSVSWRIHLLPTESHGYNHQVRNMP
jgi:hypothetical protein